MELNGIMIRITHDQMSAQTTIKTRVKFALPSTAWDDESKDEYCNPSGEDDNESRVTTFGQERKELV